MLNHCKDEDIVIHTNTVGMSFETFCKSIKKIGDIFYVDDGIDSSNINIRLDRDDNKIPLISLQIGTDANHYMVFTESKSIQCEPKGPLTFVLNSYEKLLEFEKSMNGIYSKVFNTTKNLINNAECVHISDGLVTHVTHFDLLVKRIDQKDKSVTIYIRFEV